MDEVWTHERLRTYLKREERGEKREERLEKREERGGKSEKREAKSVESGAFKELLELIDEVGAGIEIADSMDMANIPGKFDDIDDLLNRFYAGDLSGEDKKVFLSALYHSENFYRRVMTRMRQFVPVFDEDLLPSLKDVEIQSDEQILADINIQSENNVPDEIDLSFKIPIRFWTKLKSILGSENFGRRRWVYATASIGILLLITYSGVRFYNTTYQIMLAEEVLKENHRIYMADTPRLSGGYESTGIGQLMGEEDKSSYLEIAMDFLSTAEMNAPESMDIRILKARIHLMRNNLSEAEAIYENLDQDQKLRPDLLNDIGVLKYNLGKYEQARDSFQQTIALNRQFSEGYYNLVLTEVKLGNYKAAKETMIKYLSFEQDEGWLRAGRSFLR